MLRALAEAEAAAARGEVPVGAVIVDGEGTIIAAAGNRTLAARLLCILRSGLHQKMRVHGIEA